MKLFEWECFDVDAYPTAVENCLKCDLVIIDTGHISHHTFWTVRDYCKNRGIKCVYVYTMSTKEPYWTVNTIVPEQVGDTYKN